MSASLTDRLRGIVGGVPRVAPDAIAALPAAATAISAPGTADAAAKTLGGFVVPRPSGPVVVVDRHYATGNAHGRVRIADIVDTIEGGREALAVIARAWPSATGVGECLEPDAAGLLFLDLETTGLAGGAGTRAFLVGCARIDRGGIALRQFLLPGDQYERALLEEVAAWSGGHDALVTFNGRTFDVPLIETRYLYHRTTFPLEGLPHLDMLHPARRLWKARPTVSSPLDDGGCSLAALEKRLAGVARIGDVPGFEIPARYFQFVRDGDARPLESVLEHNRLDLLSTALVMARTIALVSRGPDLVGDPYECYGLARLYDRAGHSEHAEACYLRAAATAAASRIETDLHAETLRRLAWCRRRAGRIADAVAAWEELAILRRCPALLRREALEALAIHHEHRSRDLSTARALVLDLLGDDVAGRRRELAEHRLRRLERKLEARQAPWRPSLFRES
jgi:uncharacterized protein YprB with RNaseH-like and TPR domain